MHSRGGVTREDRDDRDYQSRLVYTCYFLVHSSKGPYAWNYPVSPNISCMILNKRLTHYRLNMPEIVQETRAQIWPNLAPEYICCFMIDSLSPDSFLFKSAGCQTVNFGHLMLFAFENKK